ncbi:MAG TPA: hypothetical protein VM600_10295, partial [Actinomycetota bacterium]|nr:hypothetical protein [Actinomycetota bacterium]
VYSGQRQERVIFSYEDDGVYTTFVGAAVTCLGLRRTTEDTYEPPAKRIKLPFVAGATWSETVRAGERIEKITGRIVQRVTLTVGAGTFSTWEVRERAEISGGQEGVYETTFWFAPEIGVSVKQIEHTDVRASGAHFRSNVSLSLASLP